MRQEDAIVRVRALRMEVAAGRGVADPASLTGLPDDARAAVATAVDAGAPLLPVLDGVAAGLRAERDITHAVGAAAAPARLVAVALTLLPLAAVPVLGRLTGTDLMAFYTTAAGTLVGLIGGVLWAVGVATTALIVRGVAVTGRARRRVAAPVATGAVAAVIAGPTVGILTGLLVLWWRPAPGPSVDPSLAAACDIVAAGLSAGIGPAAAVRRAADHLPRLRPDLLRLALHLDVDRAPDVDTLQPLADVLLTTTQLGSPAVAALRELAAQLRADRLAAALADAQRLPTRLTFPAALCLLPATLLLVGAPVVAEGLGAVMGT